MIDLFYIIFINHYSSFCSKVFTRRIMTTIVVATIMNVIFVLIFYYSDRSTVISMYDFFSIIIIFVFLDTINDLVFWIVKFLIVILYLAVILIYVVHSCDCRINYNLFSLNRRNIALKTWVIDSNHL
uniref:Uncharacterized protein n=1 Tax=Lepeophtheirus salmonis TaxID=72036 RepID=A0A0K2SXH1_LEPSM